MDNKGKQCGCKFRVIDCDCECDVYRCGNTNEIVTHDDFKFCPICGEIIIKNE